MSSLPQPPAPPTGDPIGRPGELTPAWRVVFVVGWVCVLLGFASVWKSARTLGLSTWWLGPAAEPRLLLVQLLPFMVPVALVLAASRNVRFLPAWGVLGATVLGAVGAGDLGRFDRMATAELAIAGGALVISIASAAGMFRNPSRQVAVGRG